MGEGGQRPAGHPASWTWGQPYPGVGLAAPAIVEPDLAARSQGGAGRWQPEWGSTSRWSEAARPAASSRAASRHRAIDRSSCSRRDPTFASRPRRIGATGGGCRPCRTGGSSPSRTARGATSKLRRGRLLGGTSWLTQFAVRGAAADFDAWAARGNPGWSFADVLPAFRRLEADAEFGGRPWHGDRGPIPITRYPELEPSEIHAAALEAFAPLGFPSRRRPQRAGRRRRRSDADELAGRRAGHVRRRVSGRRSRSPTTSRSGPTRRSPAVVVDAGRATGVRLVDGTEIHAGWIVLAAGTYGSPTILMRSGIGPAEQLRRARHRRRGRSTWRGREPGRSSRPSTSIPAGGARRPGGPILHSIATFRSAGAPPATRPT